MKKTKNYRRTVRLLFSGIISIICISMMQAQSVAVADGFAQGTTGGGSASPVTVTNASDLANYAQSSSSTVVRVGANINLGSNVLSIGSNTTLIGTGAYTITGNVRVNGQSNVIIQNLIFTNPSGIGTGDGIEVTGSNKVFITQCTFIDCADGEIDIVRAADYVTVSWCRFRYINQTSHNFTNLIGNGDNVTTDAGKLHVTMHHNWYDNGCMERMPRVRYGEVHCYNNYYGASGSNYNVGVGVYSQILVENCYFDNQSNAWKNYSSSSSDQGIIHWSGLYMVNTSYPTWAPNSSVFNPSYSYSMDAGSSVKSIVTGGAGAGGSGSGGSSGSGSSSGGSCSPTTITPYIQVNGGSWQQTSSVTVSSGASVKFGPQPTQGGSWSWSGCGTSGTSREQTVYPTSSCTSTATYTNTCGAQSTQNFTVTVSGSSSGGGSGSGGSSGGGATCTGSTTISLPFSYDGSGQHCWFTTGTINYVNSWNTNSVTINGVDFTNVWSNNMPARIDGGYYISYDGSYSWSHFEISGTKSAESLAGANIPMKLNIYPNPAPDGNFKVEVEGVSGITNIVIRDISGKQLRTVTLKTENSVTELHLNKGVYIIQLLNDDYVISKKLIVE